MPPVPDAAMAGLEAAVDSGRISDRAHRRIRAPHSRCQSAPRARQRIASSTSRASTKISALPEYEAAGAKHRRPRRHAAARSPQSFCRSIPRARCACCSSRFPPIPIRIPGETIEPEIRPRVDSLTVLARRHAIRQRQHSQAAASPTPTTSPSPRFSCAWRTAKATSAFPTISARS